MAEKYMPMDDLARSIVDSDRNRPSMQQDWHPDHNMPAPEHDGKTLSTDKAFLDMRANFDKYSDEK